MKITKTTRNLLSHLKVNNMIATGLLLFFATTATFEAQGSTFGFERKGEFYYSSDISNNIEAYYYENGVKLRNKETGKFTTPLLAWISDVSENDSISVFSRDGKRGFFNVNTGTIVIEEQYDRAWIFSEGMAAVELNDKIGFINIKNETVIPFSDQYVYNGNDYVFHNGSCIVTDSNDNYFVIDKQGKMIDENKYDLITWNGHEHKQLAIKDKGKWGIYTHNMEIILAIEYDNITPVEEPNGYILQQNGRMWQIDSNGTIVKQNLFNYSYWMKYPTGKYITFKNPHGEEYQEKEYALSIYMKYEINNRYGILNKETGKLVTPAIYRNVSTLSNDMVEVTDEHFNCHVLKISEDRVEKID